MANLANTSTSQRFVVKLSTATNVTGNGVVYTSIYDTNVQGSGIVLATGIFTCTVGGTFLFCGYPSINNLNASATTGNFKIVTTQRTYSLVNFNPGAYRSQAVTASQGCYCIAPMAAGDTASMTVQVSGTTQTMGIFDTFCAVRLF